MLNEPFMAQVRRLAEDATRVTSVCTGSLIRAAAGLLKGRRAARHCWRNQLALFGAIPDPARVVRDGRYVTGGGVTAGIDFALTPAAEIAGDDFAQGLQLALEYAPAPAVQRRPARDRAAAGAGADHGLQQGRHAGAVGGGGRGGGAALGEIGPPPHRWERTARRAVEGSPCTDSRVSLRLTAPHGVGSIS